MRQQVIFLALVASLLQPMNAASEETKSLASESPKAALGNKALSKLDMSKIFLQVTPRDIYIKGRHGVQVRVLNLSEKTLIFNADLATASLHGKDYGIAQTDEFADLPGNQPKFMADLLSGNSESSGAAIKVGSWQSVNDMLKHESPAISAKDRSKLRRETSEHMFAQRILWPGDSSSGIILFAAQVPLTGAEIRIPVRSFFEPAEKGVLRSTR